MRSFTLMELLVVMGIIGVLGAITAVAYRAVAKDTKMSSARNTVMAVLDNARGMAMRSNEIVLVAFRPRIDGNKQYVEAVLAKWTRQSVRYTVNFQSGPATQVADRFIPIAGISPRRLPQGIQVAAPAYGGLGMASSNCDCPMLVGDYDSMWVTNSYLPNINSSNQGERPGSIIGAMFAPDGRNIMINSKSDAQRIWIDYNGDNVQQWGGPLTAPIDYSVPQLFTECDIGGNYEDLFSQYAESDESFMTPAPYLAVYDDDYVRELKDSTQWNMLLSNPSLARCNRVADYSEYLRNNADRIHFNRYTGVAMK